MEKLNRLLLKLEKIKAIQNSDLKGIVFYAYDPDRNEKKLLLIDLILKWRY